MSQKPVGVTFLNDTLRRVGLHGDNFCVTWAADGSQITSMDDGMWLPDVRKYSNHLYRIEGTPENLQRGDVPGYPMFQYRERGWFGYGIASLDGTLYSFVSKCPKDSWTGPFRGMKLLKSTDNGATWTRVAQDGSERPIGPWDPARNEFTPDEMFFFEEEGRTAHGQDGYPFASCAVAQMGRDGSAAQDEFVYLYSPEGSATHELLLARVPRDQVGLRSAWRYLAGWDGADPKWSTNLAERQPMYVYPEADSRGDLYWLVLVAPVGRLERGSGAVHHGQRGHLCGAWAGR